MNDQSLWLHPDDLIDDRELTDPSQDRLGHEGIAEQLAALVSTVDAPANVALYGPWGSGKSGVANLLRQKVEGVKGVRFARFDAFKYAENPLRRNFVSAIAHEVGQSDSRFHDDLYSGRTRTDIKIPAAHLWKLFGVFALLIASVTAILAAVVAVVAWVQTGEFGANFRSMSKTTVAAGLLPAALLTALIALVNKSLHVDRSIAKPDSDEQFEELFKTLVTKSGARRLVIFVDELDRCSADEVVATLDAVRTFLGVDRCVFVIAADQQVLEQALTLAAKQETPNDESNPYYSTGSAYLDKVFQYQISLPPLLPQSVTHYAASLVEGRRGVWGEVNSDYVSSVLVPTHVTSPRRVKHLLNTYALTFRMAQARYRAGLLAEDPAASAAAIARLVTLRVEFPLFARDLTVDARLPDLVLSLLSNEKATLPSTVSERARDLARAYAIDNASPSRLLPDGEDAEEESERTAKAHNRQLLNYLRRTKQVRGPSRDLVYLQSTGTVFGLDGETAMEIETAAEDVNVEIISKRLAKFDKEGQANVLRLLAQQMRTGVGLAAPNAARTCLLLIERHPDLPISTVADNIAESVSVLYEDSIDLLDDDTMPGAWWLSAQGTEAGAAALQRLIVTAATSTSWEQDTKFLLEDPLPAIKAAPAAMSQFIAQRLVSPEGEATVRALFDLTDEALVACLTASRDEVAQAFTDALSARQQWEKAESSPAATGATPARSAATQATEDDEEEEPLDPKPTLAALAARASEREDVIQRETLRTLLRVRHEKARAAAETILHAASPLDDADLVSAVLGATSRRQSKDWPSPWLSSIAATAITPEHSVQLNGLTSTLWSRAVQAEGSDEDLAAALDSLRELLDRVPEDKLALLTPRALKSVESPVDSSEAAARRITLLRRIGLFENAGLVDSADLALAVVMTLRDTLAESLSTAADTDPLVAYVSIHGVTAVERVAAQQLADEEWRALVSGAKTCEWLDEVRQVEISLLLAEASGCPLDRFDELPTASEMTELVTEWSDAAKKAAAVWVRCLHPDPTDAGPLFEQLVREDALDEEAVEAIEVTREAWTPGQRIKFARMYLLDPTNSVPGTHRFRAIGLADCEDTDVADLLVERFTAASNNSQRQAVISLWEQAQVTDDGARKQLIEGIVLGLIRLHEKSPNAAAVDLALTALDRLGSPLPYGLKRAVGVAVEQATRGNESLESKALRVLPPLGYDTKRYGFLKRKQKVDFAD